MTRKGETLKWGFFIHFQTKDLGQLKFQLSSSANETVLRWLGALCFQSISSKIYESRLICSCLTYFKKKKTGNFPRCRIAGCRQLSNGVMDLARYASAYLIISLFPQSSHWSHVLDYSWYVEGCVPLYPSDYHERILQKVTDKNNNKWDIRACDG